MSRPDRLHAHSQLARSLLTREATNSKHLSALPLPPARGLLLCGRGRSGLCVTSRPGCTCDGGGSAASKGLSRAARWTVNCGLPEGHYMVVSRTLLVHHQQASVWV